MEKEVDQKVLQYNISQACDSLKSNSLEVNKFFAEFRERRAKYFSTIVLLSGGSIALSVNFVLSGKGHYSSSSYLIASWYLLLSSLVLCLLRNYFNDNFLHYDAFVKISKKQQKVEEAYIPFIQVANIANFKTKEERDDQIEIRKYNVELYKQNTGKYELKKKIFYYAWLFTEYFGQLSFLIGLVLLVIFGVKNL